MRFLAERKSCGLVWLDEELRVLHHYGVLTEGLSVGEPVTSTVDAMLGLDEELLALKASPETPLAIPNVLDTSGAPNEQRNTIVTYWVPEQRQFLMVIMRASSFAEIEFRLAAEVRARAIAEAEVAAQARTLQKVNQDLETANRDLQEFASVISHDLRAPLRGVRYAVSDARNALDAGATAAVTAHLELALAQARRMSTMLTGLLDYARAGRKSETAESLSTGDLAAEIANSIQTGTGHQIEIAGTWPTVVTVAEPLDIVLRNLIDNAVKHHDRPEGRVWVKGELADDHLDISVTDDGPGIDPAWHEAIFQPFKQVADSESADGAGIGLALVKKTVERFGGKIAISSDPTVARGTTFHVVWPLLLPE